MGSEDRDCMHNRGQQKASAVSLYTRFERFTQKTSMAWIAVFWLALMGVLFAVMTHYSNQRKTVITSNGVLTVQKDLDGHFYAPGTINGQAVMFVVDTGATLVSVSDKIASAAQLPRGQAMQFNTAGGSRPGTVVSGVTVQVGPLSASNLRVGTGLQMANSKDALLGQNFLSKFNMRIENDTLTLAPLAPASGP